MKINILTVLVLREILLKSEEKIIYLQKRGVKSFNSHFLYNFWLLLNFTSVAKKSSNKDLYKISTLSTKKGLDLLITFQFSWNKMVRNFRKKTQTVGKWLYYENFPGQVNSEQQYRLNSTNNKLSLLVIQRFRLNLVWELHWIISHGIVRDNILVRFPDNIRCEYINRSNNTCPD